MHDIAMHTGTGNCGLLRQKRSEPCQRSSPTLSSVGLGRSGWRRALALVARAGVWLAAAVALGQTLVPVSDAVSTALPAVPGDGVLVEVFNGVNNGVVTPASLEGRTPHGITLSPRVDFPNPGATVAVGSRFTVFFANTTVPPEAVRALNARNFSLRITGLLKISRDLDRNANTEPIDVRLAVGSDDGFHLRIGSEFIGSAGVRGFAVSAYNVSFEDEGLYPFTLLFSANATGVSGLEFRWRVGQQTADVIVPQGRLYLAANLTDQVIAFEELPANTLVTDQYLDLGIRFQTLSGDLQTTAAKPNRFVPVSPSRVFGDPATDATALGEVELSFVLPGTVIPSTTGLLTFFVIDAEETGATVRAYDLGGAPIYQSVHHGGGGSQERVVIEHPGIARVRITLGQGLDTVALDSLAFRTPRDAPDLVLAALDVPSRAELGQPLPVVWTVTNEGSMPARGPWTDTCWLSTDDQPGDDTPLATLVFRGTLDPGQTLTRTQQVLLPLTALGDRYLLVTTDTNDAIGEIGEPDNNTGVAIKPTTLTAADLVLTSLNASAVTQFGDPLTVAWTVKNAGSAPARASWTDRVVLAPTDGAGAEPVLLDLPAVDVVPLEPGSSYTRNQQVVLPVRPGLDAGQYVVRVLTDAAAAQIESNEVNNAAVTAPFDLALPPLPDLVVVDVQPPAALAPGQIVTLSWAIGNRGPATATGPWVEDVFLAFQPGGRDYRLGRFVHAGPMGAGAETVRTQPLEVPRDLPTGALWLVVFVDAAAQVLEQREDNNLLSASTPTQSAAALRFALRSSRLEAEGRPLRVWLSRNGATTSPLTARLVPSDPDVLIVPSSVDFAPGYRDTSFEARVRARPGEYGERALTLRTSAEGYAGDETTLTVVYPGKPALTLALAKNQVTEGETIAASVSRGTAAAAPLTVQLAASRADQVQVPSSVVIPASASSAEFAITAVDDSLIEPELEYTLTASAAGFGPAAATLHVPANDAPALVLSFDSPTVSEQAGFFAARLTIRRPTVEPHPLFLALESTTPTLARASPTAAIEAGQTAVVLPISVTDDTLLNGSRPVRFTVYVTPRNSAVRLTGGLSAELIVTDDESPTLTVTLAREVVGEGLPAATSGVVRRNTAPVGELLVRLASSDTSELTVPEVVTIPDGAGETTFSVGTVDDGVTDGSQHVLVVASADGYQGGSALVVVSDLQAPDLVVTQVSGPANGLTEAPFQVQFREENLGLGPAGDGWTQQVFLSTDPIPGNDQWLGEVRFTGVLGPGQFAGRTLAYRLPQRPGDYWLVVRTDADDRVAELVEENNMTLARQPIRVDAAYRATVETDVTVAPAGTVVPLRGGATRSGGGPAPFALVSIHIKLRDTHRTLSALTDADGKFTASFVPLPGEAGRYTIGAGHPGFEDVETQDEFTLLGLRFEPNELDHGWIAGASVTGRVAIVNLSDLPIADLTAQLLDSPPDLLADFRLPSTLPGNGSFHLDYVLTHSSEVGWRGRIRLQVANADGVAATLPVAVEIRARQPRLVAEPTALELGVVRGEQALVDITLANRGGASSGPLNVVLPDLAWLNSAQPDLPPLAPGETTRLTLVLTPAAEVPLGEYRGRIGVVGESGYVAVPFIFRTLSEAYGAFEVEVQDEYTFYAEGAPRVPKARVTVKDASSRELVGEALTDADGLARFPSLREGYYGVEVSADRHSSFRGHVFVAAGRTNDLPVLLSLETVRYVWTVTPTEIPDRTRITIETEFETVVPVPVVTAQPMYIDLTEFTEPVTQVELTLRNHGLIAAQHVRLTPRGNTRWAVEPLIRNVGTLPANTALTIPIAFRRLAPASTALASARPASGDPGPCSPVSVTIDFDIPCGLGNINKSFTVSAGDETGDCGVGPSRMQPANPIAVRFPRGGGGGRDPIPDPFAGDSLLQFAAPEFATPAICKTCIPALLKGLFECGLNLVGGEDWFKCGYGTFFSCGLDLLTGANNTTVALDCGGAALSCLEALGKTLSGVGPVVGGLSCANTLLAACAPSGGSYAGVASAAVSLHSPARGRTLESHGLRSGLAGASVEGIRAGPVLVSDEVAFLRPLLGQLAVAVARVDAVIEAHNAVVGDRAWFHEQQRGPRLGNWLEAFRIRTGPATEAGYRISAGERESLLELLPPIGLDSSHLNKFIDRWNRTADYWDAGRSRSTDVPAGESADFIAADVVHAKISAARSASEASQAAGFETPLAELQYLVTAIRAAVYEHLRRLNDPQLVGAAQPNRSEPVATARTTVAPAQSRAGSGGGGVCARVKIRLDQDAVLTRDAFNARLDIVNGDTGPLTQVRVDLALYNAAGHLANDLFAIRPPTLENLADVQGSGSMAPGATGRATWLLVPTPEAAPTRDTVAYFVGGTFSYVLEGVSVAVPLSPAPIHVHPSPRLVIDYFHERDVLGDDPFTEPVEPSVPYSLAVRVQNRGLGVAKKFQIASGRPQIVENQKGLLVDFEILGTEVAGRSMSPSLTAYFGDLAPGDTQIARWLLRGTLQGLFVDYRATFQHLDSLGDPRLSLIDSVAVHELIHIVQAGGAYADGQPDFLVNELPDGRHLPDVLYLSGGTQHPVAAVLDGELAEPPQPGNLEVQLTLVPPAGFLYVRLPDPSAGRFRLRQVTRSDGVPLPLGSNAWTSDRTFVGESRRPLYEHNLHLFDLDSPGRYTLAYAPWAEAGDTTPPTSSVLALPEVATREFLVRWSGQDQLGGSGIAGYDVFVSAAAGPFTRWHRATTKTAAFFSGDPGQTYAFYSVAVDRSGNREAPPTVPDTHTTTTSNTAPVIAAIEDVSLDEGQTLAVQVLATDIDLPGDRLTYRLSGAPSGMRIDPLTGAIAWLTSEAHGPKTYTVTVVVADHGLPSLSASRTFKVTVNEVNTAPRLPAAPDLAVDEGLLLRWNFVATDADLPRQTLRYRLAADAPLGASIQPVTGQFTWVPSEAQGGASYPITAIVTDDATPPGTDSQTFRVSVHDWNSAPRLAPIPNQVVFEGSTLALQSEATDSDLPADLLTFSLESGAPDGLVLEPDTGRLTWTPSSQQIPSTSLIAVRVTDNGTPPLAASRTFTVEVRELRLGLNLPRSLPGGSLEFTFKGEPDQEYRIETSPDLVRWTFLFSFRPQQRIVVLRDDAAPAAVSGRFYRVGRP